MSERRTESNSTWAKLGLGLGAGAVVLAFPVFGLQGKVPALPTFEQGVLMAVFIVAMATCSLVGLKRPILGLLVLPPFFFGLSCLACWWVSSR